MIRLTVLGTPTPQGNKTAFYNKKAGKVVMTEGRRDDARLRFEDWRHAVRSEAQREIERTGQVPLDGPVSISLFFGLARPVSAPKRRRTWPTARPDADKLARAVLDAITGVLITNDSRVVHLAVSKDYTTRTGVVIELFELSDTELYETPADLGRIEPVQTALV